MYCKLFTIYAIIRPGSIICNYESLYILKFRQIKQIDVNYFGVVLCYCVFHYHTKTQTLHVYNRIIGSIIKHETT